MNKIDFANYLEETAEEIKSFSLTTAYLDDFYYSMKDILDDFYHTAYDECRIKSIKKIKE